MRTTSLSPVVIAFSYPHANRYKGIDDVNASYAEGRRLSLLCIPGGLYHVVKKDVLDVVTMKSGVKTIDWPCR